MKINNNENLMIRNFYKYIAMAIMGLLISGISQSLSAAPLQVIPQFGYSQVVGSSGDDWKPGFNLGLDIFNLKPVDGGGFPLIYGVHVAYNRWKVDSDNMLETDGRDMHVERESGVKDTWDITGLARYAVPHFQSRGFRHWFDVGLGVHYINTTAVEVKGFYRYGDTAVNREISREAISDLSPSVTLGFTAMINRQIQSSIRYQHFFQSGEDRSGALLISLGMMAR